MAADGKAKKESSTDAFLKAGLAQKWTAIGGLGGNEFKIEGDVGGSALIEGDHLVHLALFSN